MSMMTLETGGCPLCQRSVKARVATPHPYSLAKRWVERSAAGGFNPTVRQQSLSCEDAGEWRIATLKRSGGDVCPALYEELWDEAFMILADQGRVKFVPDLKIWHGDCLLDDCSARAVAFRLRFARRALGMDFEEFYCDCSIDEEEAEAMEACYALSPFPAGILKSVSWRHGIPLEWLEFGAASEIEL